MKQSFMQQNLGESVDILWEGQKEEINETQHRVFGYTPNYIRVATMISDGESIENQIIPALSKEINENYLLTERV